VGINLENNKPLVSIIVNCYNGEFYLKSCLQSILNQTYNNLEIIFWDNASTDNSAEIFKSYKDHRFRYFKSITNVSLGQARGWAVEKCKGEYIAFLDVDDEWIPTKTELQVENILSSGAVLSYGGIIEIEEESKNERINLPRYSTGDIFADNLMQFEINVPTSMISRKALMDKSLNFDLQVQASEEYCLFMQLIYDEKVCVINKPIAKYLIRKNSLTAKAISRWSIERIYTLDKIIQKHPEAKLKYVKEFVEAYDRADYYKARYLWSIDEKKKATELMNKIKFHDFKYFLLFIISLLPFNIWSIVHNIKTKRV
jgi:glycosyltransferase involved in cell wall biosynthesis